MMVETILDSSQDFGMSNGVLPQWKRELLQRRAARARPAPPTPPAPPAPTAPTAPPPEDEELRYGPGIVKRLKSRYLSLALRDAPRRRPSVLRRAASLEHLLDERPPPAPRPPRPRPASLAPLPPRRDSVKRARSVDALSRLDSREDPPLPPPPPAPPAPPPTPPAAPRAPRPPRRPTPLLRETERPPPDLVKSTLRKFESVGPRRGAPSARVSAVLRGLEGRSSTPEPGGRERSASPPAADLSAISAPEPPPAASRPVSREALDGIALAGSTVRYSFEAPRHGSHLPLVCASNPVLLGRARSSPRRVGVIRPMPAATLERAAVPEEAAQKPAEPPRAPTPPTPIAPPAPAPEPAASPRREPPSALVEPIPRPPPEESRGPSPPPPQPKPELNGHAERERSPVRLSSWKAEEPRKEGGAARSWVRGGSPAARRRPPAPAPAATSVVFNFSARRDVPDYIENDGIILRNKRDKIKATDSGVVVLRAEAVRDSEEEEEEEGDGGGGGPPSPCAVRFVNDNVLINGRSSMPHKPDRARTARLKIQFDDSLTRTFEYPSETSLAEDAAPAPAPAPALAANTHIASAALARYTPSKTHADVFQLGVTRLDTAQSTENGAEAAEEGVEEEAGAAEEEGDARPCAAGAARSWSEARTHATDLLFWLVPLLHAPLSRLDCPHTDTN